MSAPRTPHVSATGSYRIVHQRQPDFDHSASPAYRRPAVKSALAATATRLPRQSQFRPIVGLWWRKTARHCATEHLTASPAGVCRVQLDSVSLVIILRPRRQHGPSVAPSPPAGRRDQHQLFSPVIFSDDNGTAGKSPVPTIFIRFDQISRHIISLTLTIISIAAGIPGSAVPGCPRLVMSIPSAG